MTIIQLRKMSDICWFKRFLNVKYPFCLLFMIVNEVHLDCWLDNRSNMKMVGRVLDLENCDEHFLTVYRLNDHEHNLQKTDRKRHIQALTYCRW